MGDSGDQDLPDRGRLQYTSFTQERGDEAGAKLAARFAAISRQAVDDNGGSVVELRGDKALALFDSACQAIRAATLLQQ